MGKLNASFKALRSGSSGLGRHLHRGAPAYTVLLISVLLSLLASYYVQQNVEAQAQTRFDEVTQATQQAIERRTKAYLDVMFGARALFYASNSVTREEWSNYVEAIEPATHFKGLQALSYAQQISPDQREAFMQKAKEEGLPPIRPDLNPKGGEEERTSYFPITYTGPLDQANQSMLGYDLYAEAQHREAMDKATDTAKPQATKMVYVMSEASPTSSADLALREGFVVYLPVYREGVPQATVEQRRRALRGFVVGSFVIRAIGAGASTEEPEGLLDGVFKGSFNPAIDFEVYDGKNPASSPLLYDRDGIKRGGEETNESLFSKMSHIEVAGREWSLYFATLPEFEQGSESELPAYVLTSGVVVSLMLFGVTWMLVRSRTLAERASRDLEGANRELEAANTELEAFSYSVSHDLRAPLRSIEGFSQILLEDYSSSLEEEAQSYLSRLRAASRRMAQLIDDLLELSRVTRTTLRRQKDVNLSSLAKEVVQEIKKSDPAREVEFVIAEGLVADADGRLVAITLENLLSNAFKFTSRKEGLATIEFGAISYPRQEGEELAYYVKDDGVGFDMAYASKLFGPFQRLHGEMEFEGTGVGLATVARIVGRHGGRVWAVGKPGEGATFYFTLGVRRRGS